MLDQRMWNMRGVVALVVVCLWLVQAVSAQTTQEGQVSAPDPNAYPMNAAAIEAANLEIEQPPEGDWATGADMLSAYRRLMEDLIIGRPSLQGEEGHRVHRRLADFAGSMASQFPTHEYTPVMLMNRWRFLGEESLYYDEAKAIDPTLAGREMADFFESGGKMPEGITAYVQGIRVNSLAIQAKREWKAINQNAGDQAVHPPKFDEAIAMADLIARGGFGKQAALHLAEISIYLRQQGFTADADELDARVIDQFPDSDAAARLEGLRRNRAGVGKPIGLTFTDFLTRAYHPHF